jgi:hypothetical protein
LNPRRLNVVQALASTAAVGTFPPEVQPMSEYQYYEFIALDRPLTAEQIDEVREFSSRAEISSTSFVNEYNFGSFKGDPAHFLERYFDVMLYYANWGTHRLMMNVPADAIDPAMLEHYCVGDSASFQRKGAKLILDFNSQEEPGEYEEDESGSMASLAPIRDELLRGDLRPLYLGWLLSVQSGEVEEDEAQPPVPPGLGKLSAAQESLAEFLRIDVDLFAAAAHRSADLHDKPEDVRSMVAGLSPAQRDELLAEFLQGNDPHLAVRTRRRLRPPLPELTEAAPGGTAGEMLAEADHAREEREAEERRIASERAARKQAEAERQRNEHLAALGRRGEAAWRDVNERIDRKNAQGYDEAITLLIDLRDVALSTGALDVFTRRVHEIRSRYTNRPSFQERLARRKLI